MQTLRLLFQQGAGSRLPLMHTLCLKKEGTFLTHRTLHESGHKSSCRASMLPTKSQTTCGTTHKQSRPTGSFRSTASRFRAILFLLLLTLPALAQEVEPTVELGEVEVKADRIIKKTDGMLLYPSEQQKTSSRSGYSLLQQLTLPNIRVDEVGHTISAIDQRGSVQIRINGIIVDKAEMLSLDPKSIRTIHFIDNPGVRYGDGIAYVIEITTRRADNGYTLGTSFTQALTTLQGDYTVYGKWNTGKSELSLNYSIGYQNYSDLRTEETAHYHLNDGSVYTIQRNDLASRNQSLNNQLKLTYNLADSTRYVFQASLSGDFSHVPNNFNQKQIVDGKQTYTALEQQQSRSGSPVLDLYYFQQFTPRQSLTLNAVGTYISTRSSDSYDEGSPYRYDVDGRTYSLLSEAIYENRLKPFTLSAGLNYSQKYTNNEYTGDVSAATSIHNNRVYLFSEIKGLWGNLRYSAGIGGSYLHYRQQSHSYDYWSFCPKAALSYNFTHALQLSYNFQMSERTSRVAMISDASIRNNRMEWTVGSPDLKPNREMYHLLRLTYTNNRLQTSLEGFYKQCLRPNMAVYERTADDRFIYTQRNQKEIDVLNAMAYASYWLMPEKLSVTAYGGLFRCFNFGQDYTHCYTSYFVTGAVNAYLGNLSLHAYADNGSRFLEGETKGYSGSDITLKAAYSYKDWQFALIWQEPFQHKYKLFESEILNRNLQKHTALYSGDACNLVNLTVTWRLTRGRKFRDVERSIQLKDKDTGIIR
ncbi:TonB-dependent receptor [Bacteroides mediterraneensis]|uniref:TonB-dependent receptor n=1 Tax=Bacteroides mediterraneensis TaxID=1841856 RepID=UPI001EF565E1|nr:TonB-dependent receptor [Bacteroides mediterraneensis]